MRNFKFITIEELKKNIKDYSILDIRREDDLNKVKAFDNYYTLENLSKIDNEAKIVVVCYKGFSAQNIAEELFDQGYENVYVLEGGVSSL